MFKGKRVTQSFAALAVLLSVTAVHAAEPILAITASDLMNDILTRVLFSDVKHSVMPVGGADGLLAVQAVTKQKSSRHLAILVSGNDTYEINAVDGKQPESLTPVGQVAEMDIVLAVRRDSPIQDLKDLAALENPSIMAFGSPKSMIYRIVDKLRATTMPQLIIVTTTSSNLPGGNTTANIMGGHVTAGTLAESVVLKNPTHLRAIHKFDERMYMKISVANGTEPERIEWLKSVINAALADKEKRERLTSLGYILPKRVM